MDSRFKPQLIEKKIYQFWEKNKFFEAKIDSSFKLKEKKPFSIILPPPNANADLHLGHAMYVYGDIMIRYHKMKGFEVLWLPGADHAGFETQYVFEKELMKEGKSRFDYDRETLFQMIWDFVMKNKSNMEEQLRRLGFALDWSKEKFTLDKEIVKIVYETFKKLYDKGLIYRAKRLVNYCTKCGTSFSDLEVVYKEKKDPLYFLKYGPLVLATVRPETKFGDTAIAVHPKDKRYQKWIGKEVEVESLLGKFKLKVIADEVVDPKFGTGVIKVTPAHDFTDFEIGLRHNLEVKQVIDFNGKLNEKTGNYAGLDIYKARKMIVEDLRKKNLIVKVIENYQHRVGTCYKCETVIEPLPKEQWFVKIRPLADKAKEIVRKEEIKIYPKKFKKILLQWLDNFYDWNISRQIVWGIRIPAYKCNSELKTQNLKLKTQTIKSEQNSNLNKQWFVSLEKPKKCLICGNCDFEQDKDTFDTWFSSAQWPFATLASCSISKTKDDNSDRKEFNNPFFNYFYPTSVMETGYDILPWWVARMIMIGYFFTKKVPFKTVFFHGLIRDKYGKKMSKSKGNVINPMEMINKYGADALRLALVFNVKEGNDSVVSEDKIIGMRNFANKVWNIGRFVYLQLKTQNLKLKTQSSKLKTQNSKLKAQNLKLKTQNSKVQIIKNLERDFKKEKKRYLKLMENYQFSKALGLLYKFLWHRLADYYIEELKEELYHGNIEALRKLKDIYFENLKLLHPFMPFVTEAVWQAFYGENQSIINCQLL